jgi:hypothetical protein
VIRYRVLAYRRRDKTMTDAVIVSAARIPLLGAPLISRPDARLWAKTREGILQLADRGLYANGN